MRNHEIIHVAGLYIRINFAPCEWRFIRDRLMSDIRQYYRSFLIDSANRKVDFTIDVVPRKESLVYSLGNKDFMELSETIDSRHMRTYYQVGIVQFQFLMNKVIYLLLSRNDGFVLHASASAIGGKAALFMGKSGAGKSTIMKLLDGTSPALADDSVIIRKINRNYFLYQTLTTEKESWVKKSPHPFEIGAICFLHKSKRFEFAPVSDIGEIMGVLIAQLKTEEKYLPDTIAQLKEFALHNRRFFHLYFVNRKEPLTEFVHAKMNF